MNLKIKDASTAGTAVFISIGVITAFSFSAIPMNYDMWDAFFENSIGALTLVATGIMMFLAVDAHNEWKKKLKAENESKFVKDFLEQVYHYRYLIEIIHGIIKALHEYVNYENRFPPFLYINGANMSDKMLLNIISNSVNDLLPIIKSLETLMMQNPAHENSPLSQFVNMASSEQERFFQFIVPFKNNYGIDPQSIISTSMQTNTEAMEKNIKAVKEYCQNIYRDM